MKKYSTPKTSLIRPCTCLCGAIAELRNDRNMRPYVTCQLCGMKLFFQSKTALSYLGFEVFESYASQSCDAHRQAVTSKYYELLRDQEIKRRKALEEARKPRPRGVPA